MKEVSSDAAMPAMAPPAPAKSENGSSPVPQAQSVWVEQKLIRTAEIELTVRSIDQALRELDSLVKPLDALVADARRSDREGERQAFITIRVPSERFKGALESLRGLGTIESETVNTEDVTRAYADLEVRLSVKEETVTRLRRLLTDRTAKLSDVLEVERELARAVAELEQMKGERRYYDQRVAISTITVRLNEHRLVGSSALTPVIRALRESLAIMGSSLSFLISSVAALLPWALLAGVIWLVFGRRLGIRRKEGPPPPP